MESVVPGQDGSGVGNQSLVLSHHVARTLDMGCREADVATCAGAQYRLSHKAHAYVYSPVFYSEDVR